MAYATLTDLAQYLNVQESELEDDSERLLDFASTLIDKYTLGKIDPSNSNHAEAAKIAVCAQVEYWQETGDSIGELEKYDSMSLGSFSISLSKNYPTSIQHQTIAPRAYQVLFMEGLLYCGVDTK